MKTKFGQIVEGWRNNLIPPAHLKKEIEKVSSERTSICESCKFHSKNYKSVRPDAHCVNCGCTLSAKTKCLSCECPTGKWKAEMSSEEEAKLKENVEKKNSKTH